MFMARDSHCSTHLATLAKLQITPASFIHFLVIGPRFDHCYCSNRRQHHNLFRIRFQTGFQHVSRARNCRFIQIYLKEPSRIGILLTEGRSTTGLRKEKTLASGFCFTSNSTGLATCMTPLHPSTAEEMLS